MSARDNLSPVQFVDTDKVGGYTSLDVGDRMDSRHSLIGWNDVPANDEKPYPHQEPELGHRLHDKVGDKDHGLMGDIARNGMSTPIHVRTAAATKKFPEEQVVVNGHHRYEAARQLGMKQVPVFYGGRLSNEETGVVRHGR